MTQGQYVAAAYGVVFVVVLGYVAIIAAKLSRIQRQTAELLELVQRRPAVDRADATPREAAGKA
jgi:CcmD family protein